MTKTQSGWFLFIVGLLVIGVLLTGDVIALVHSGGKIDMAFVLGMLAHVGAVVAAFVGGWILPSGMRALNAMTVSDDTRAKISNEQVGV